VTRKQRVTRAVYGVYVVIIAAFVVSNVTQVGRQIFGPNGGAATKPAAKVNDACAKAIEGEMRVIELARLAASTEQSEAAAATRYASERERARSRDLEPACSGDPSGADALAALARFDRASESHAVRIASDLTPVRLSTQSFISGHPL
jgi:hypothetical protein